MQLSRELGVIVMAIRTNDGRMLFNPSADTAVHGGDFLIVMGQVQNLRALESLLTGAARHGDPRATPRALGAGSSSNSGIY